MGLQDDERQHRMLNPWSNITFRKTKEKGVVMKNIMRCGYCRAEIIYSQEGTPIPCSCKYGTSNPAPY